MDAAKKKKGFLKPSTRENFCIYWYNFRSNKLSMVGLAIVVISLIFAIFAPYVAPFPEHAGAYVDLANAGVAPNATFWFGTDVTGRDILSRVIFGFRGALKMAVVVLAISVPVGTFLGLLAGYYHHTWVDTVIMRMTYFPGVAVTGAGHDHSLPHGAEHDEYHDCGDPFLVAMVYKTGL